MSIAVFSISCAEIVPPAEETAPAADIAMSMEVAAENMLSEHMAAEAMLTAHYLSSAVKAGMSADEINGVLTAVADGSAISEFWVSDENGKVVYSNIPGAEFAFPTDPESDSQAAPFASLLTGDRTAVDQDFMSRELDGKVFKYVAAAGVDQARIVQIGVAAPTDSDSP